MKPRDSTSLQRVNDAIALRTPDKVPFHAYQSPELAMRMAGLRAHEMYLDPEAYFEAMAESNDVFKNDFIQPRTDPHHLVELLAHAYEDRSFPELADLDFAEGDGALLVRCEGGKTIGRIPLDSKTAFPIAPIAPLVQTLDDVDRIEIVPCEELLQRPRWKMVARYVERFGGRAFVAGGIGGASANLLDMYLGTQRALTATIEEFDLCRAIIERHYAQLHERILACKALGVDGVVTGDACASCSFFSPRVYRELFKPAQERVIADIHAQGLPVVLHICGVVSPILEDMADTGADMIEGLDPPSARGDIDMADAKQRVGSRTCLKGNIDAVHVIEPETPEAVYAACRDVLRAAGPDGFILSTEQITADTPLENVMAMVQARDDYAGAH